MTSDMINSDETDAAVIDSSRADREAGGADADVPALRELFNRQMRREVTPDRAAAFVERVGGVVRHVDTHGGWNGVLWSDLPDGAAVDAAIAEQVRYFSTLPGDPIEEFEWKLYDYDLPEDLGERLLAAGFEAQEPETVLVARTADFLAAFAGAPDLAEAGVTLQEVTDQHGVDMLVGVTEKVFGSDHAEFGRKLMSQLEESPRRAAAVLALAGGEAVSSARLEFNPGTSFAGLWGGGTVPQWRGRGIYRATVAFRARIAAEHGYEYLQLDASEMSRPIMQRLGFHALGITTPYVYRPGSAG